MENTDGVINIRKKLEEEMKRRGISTEYLSEEEIEKAISDLIVKINVNIDNSIKSVLKLINEKYNNKKIGGKDKEKIISLLLSGRSSEEIHHIDEFEIYPIEKIRSIEEKLATPILAIQLMPLDEIATRRKIQKQSIYYAMKNHSIDGKNISEIRKEKEKELERRLTEGQSIQDILSDKELNVCEAGVKAIQERIETQSNDQERKKSTRAISKEDKKAILDLLVKGKTIKEISDIEEYKKYSLESLEKFQTNKINQGKIMAVRLMPIAEIANALGIKKQSVYIYFKDYKLDGKTIGEIREEKTKEIERRLLEGQSIQDILSDKRLNVCESGIKAVQEKIEKQSKKQLGSSEKTVSKAISKEDKKAILDLLVQGKTIEEISDIEKYKKYSIERLEKFQTNKINQGKIMAVRLMPIAEIADALGIKKESVYIYFKDYKLDGKTIGEIREEKEREIEIRLAEGQSIQDILNDKELNVCESGVKAVQEKIEEQSKKQIKAPSRAISKEDKKAILDLLVQGRTIEEINAMEEFKGYTIETLEKFQSEKTNVSKIMAIQLFSVNEIAQTLGVKKETIYYYLKNYKLDGKTILEIRKEKERKIESRLAEGQSIQDILNDKELNVCESAVNSVVENERKKLEEKESKKTIKKEKQQKRKGITKETRDQIIQMLYAGKKIEEIAEQEEYREISVEELEKIQQKNMDRILALQLMPVSEIAKKMGIGKSTIQYKLRNTTINGKTIVEIRAAKIEEIERRLAEGQSIQDILNDGELNVCEEFVNMRQFKSGRKEQKQTKPKEETKKTKKVSRKDNHAIALLFINGRSIEEIRAMEEYRIISDDALKKIQEENQMRILAVRLVPINEIVKRVGKKRITVYTNINKFDYGGKILKDIQEQKLNEIRRRLAEGENIDSLAQDGKLNVCREVLEEEKAKLKGTKLNSQNSERKIQRSQNSSKPKKINTNQKQDKEQMSKLDIMRKKYKAKYEREIKQTQKQVKKPLTPEENEKVNKALLEMLEAVNSCDGEKSSSRAMIKSILNNAESVFRKNLSLDQASRLVSIMESQKINPALQFFMPDITGKIKWIKKSTYSRLAEAIDTQMEDITDIDKLENLSKMLKYDMERSNLYVTTIKSKLQRKIDKLRTEERLRSLREDIPDDIRTIIEGIAKGELDIKEANDIIAQKAKEKVSGRKATRFTLTEEQERRQYIAQIKKALNEQGNKYPIENPEKTMEILKQLTNDSSLTILNTVIANQMSRKKFDEAQALCQEYIARSKGNTEDIAYLYSVRKRIRNSKIGDLVYRTIHSDISPEDEEKFWNLLQDGLRMGNVKMSNISIGKTQDGLRTITLEDVWPDDAKEIKK